MLVSRNGGQLSSLEQHKLQGKFAWHLTPLLYVTQLKSVYTQRNMNSSITWCGVSLLSLFAGLVVSLADLESLWQVLSQAVR